MNDLFLQNLNFFFIKKSSVKMMVINLSKAKEGPIKNRAHHKTSKREATQLDIQSLNA